MADMDTYDGEQRGYEGNRIPTAQGFHGHGGIEPSDTQYHYHLYLYLTAVAAQLTIRSLQMIVTMDVSALVLQDQTVMATPGSAMSL